MSLCNSSNDAIRRSRRTNATNMCHALMIDYKSQVKRRYHFVKTFPLRTTRKAVTGLSYPQVGRLHVGAAVAAGRAGSPRARARRAGAALGGGRGSHPGAPGPLAHQLPPHAAGAVLPATATRASVAASRPARQIRP